MSTRALIIGIDGYTQHRLRGCVQDALAFRDFIVRRICVPEENIFCLLARTPADVSQPHAPTQDEIITVLRRLAIRSRPGDRLFVYFAGASTEARVRRDENVTIETAIVPLDGEKCTNKLLLYRELENMLGEIAASETDVTLVMDTGRSGASERSMESEGELDLSWRPKLSTIPATDGVRGVQTVFSTQRGHEASVLREPGGRLHGAFTASLLSVLDKTIEHGNLEPCWADIWSALQVELEKKAPDQKPELAGDFERPVFGGNSRRRGLPPDARARIILSDAFEKLRIRLEPANDRAEALLDSIPLCERVTENEDLRLIRISGDEYLLCDDEYEAPRVRADQPQVLAAIIEHYSRYSRPIRLARRAEVDRTALEVRLLDVPRRGAPFAEHHERAAGGQLLFRATEPFCARVYNRAAVSLNVALFDCGWSGRVQKLGRAQIDAGGTHIFWNGGAPFRFLGRKSGGVGVDRLVFLGSPDPRESFDQLELRSPSFEELLRLSEKSIPSITALPGLEGAHAAVITVLIYEE